jgi:UDP-N-acetylmuramoyl-L-alanyl-D-glutamate--2,6-diaminopimelate ligase
MLLMRLRELARGVAGAAVLSGGDYEVTGVTADSRRAGPGDLFVAVPGLTVDGHDFAHRAAEAGAAVATMRDTALPAGAAVLRVADTRVGLAELAAEFHGRPARRLAVAGVTGTDGKTTVTHLAAWILESAGRRCGSLSTVGLRAGGEEQPNVSGQTTMDATEVQAWLGRMVAEGATHAVLEVTSHGLVQHRADACEFDVAAYTNVGYDHLDYHATWDDYLEAKAKLLELCAAGAPKGIPKTGILNRDDRSYERLRDRPIERRWSYSIAQTADLAARDLELRPTSTCFTLNIGGEEHRLELPMPASFNVSNALCAAGICLAFGLRPGEIVTGLIGFPGVPGRLERVDLGQPFAVVIDFAHAAGALKNTLRELRSQTERRLLLVFGSTGRADHDRAGMGRAAAEGSDWFVITSDDPVREDPEAIAREVAAGASNRRAGVDYEIVIDRRQAIRRALARAEPGDTVLLAGKGHERSMMVASGREPWDERAEAEAALRELGFAGG